MHADGEPRTRAINLDLAEGRLIFEALAELPFKQVFGLIGRLNRMANEIAGRGGNLAERQSFRLDADELELIRHALGGLPFKRVNALLASLREQTREDAEGAADGRA